MKWNFEETGKTNALIKQIEAFIPKAKRMYMVETYRQLTIATPVLTGRARWGWNCSVSQKDVTVPADGKYSLDANRANKTFTVGIPMEETFYITNNVPYIGRLNDGYSRQAPARFFELCAYNAMDKLQKKYGS